MEQVLKVLLNGGPAGIVAVVAIVMIRHLYRRIEHLQAERVKALEEMTEKQHQQNLALRNLAKSMVRRLKALSSGDDENGDDA
jgi:hypothetical protein